jgi:CDP-glucose 4,6-dehydratase
MERRRRAVDWKNKRVMVTGAVGFIGNALAMRLLNLDAEVYMYDRVTNRDVLDIQQLENRIKVNEIELVYHLAAQAHVPIANKYPYDTLKTNILGTLNVLDICDQLRIPVIIASSDKAYGEATQGYTTDTPLNAKYPYDVSKACADKIAQVYIDRGAFVKIMRLCNVFGPGDTHRHRLIPHVIQAYMAGERPVLRGSPAMVREWIYINDAVDAYLDAAGNPGPIFAVGGCRRTVGAVVETIRQIIGGEPPIVLNDAADEIWKQEFIHPDIVDEFEQCIAQTIEWWRHQ